MPYISILIGVLYAVDYLLNSIILIWTKHHKALVTLVQNYVFAYDLAKCTFIQKIRCKQTKVIHRMIILISPIKSELITAIRIICKVPGIYTIRDYEQLNIIEESVKRSLMISLDLIICLFKLDTSFLEFNLHQRKTIDQDRNIITTFLPAFNSDLIGNLELILAPLLCIQERDPYYLTIFKFEILKVTEFLGFFKASTSFKMEHDLVELSLCEFRTPHFFKSLTVMFLQLKLEIAAEILFFFYLHILIAILLQSPDQSLLQ